MQNITIKLLIGVFSIFLLTLAIGYSSCTKDVADDAGITGDGDGGGGMVSEFYVDASATGGNDGTSWANAFTDLQAGIDEAAKHASSNVVKIYVAVGNYSPSSWPNGGSTDREKHFALKDNVEVYGGFPAGGGDSATADRSLTVLNGDIGVKDDNTDNVYHVFYHTADSGLTTKAKLENLTISGGNANGGPVIPNQGGGMYNDNSSLTLNKVTFTANNAAANGAGMYNINNSSPILTNVNFSGNAGNFGGGMTNETNSSPSLTDVNFSNNTANNGGGLRNLKESSPTLTRVTFTNNVVTFIGGGMTNQENSSPTLNNVTFNDNRAPYGGGIYNSVSSPSLTDVTFNNNIASSLGGGLMNDNSNTTLTNVTFSGNQAQDGGGVYNRTTSNPSLTGCTFTGNTATNAGGAMYSDNTSTPNFADNPLTPTTDALASQTNGYYKAP